MSMKRIALYSKQHIGPTRTSSTESNGSRSHTHSALSVTDRKETDRDGNEPAHHFTRQCAVCSPHQPTVRSCSPLPFPRRTIHALRYPHHRPTTPRAASPSSGNALHATSPVPNMRTIARVLRFARAALLVLVFALPAVYVRLDGARWRAQLRQAPGHTSAQAAHDLVVHGFSVVDPDLRRARAAAHGADGTLPSSGELSVGKGREEERSGNTPRDGAASDSGGPPGDGSSPSDGKAPADGNSLRSNNSPRGSGGATVSEKVSIDNRANYSVGHDTSGMAEHLRAPTEYHSGAIQKANASSAMRASTQSDTARASVCIGGDMDLFTERRIHGTLLAHLVETLRRTHRTDVHIQLNSSTLSTLHTDVSRHALRDAVTLFSPASVRAVEADACGAAPPVLSVLARCAGRADWTYAADAGMPLTADVALPGTLARGALHSAREDGSGRVALVVAHRDVAQAIRDACAARWKYTQTNARGGKEKKEEAKGGLDAWLRNSGIAHQRLPDPQSSVE